MSPNATFVLKKERILPEDAPRSIVKRDGRKVSFDPARIETAITKCFNSISERPEKPASEFTDEVISIVAVKFPEPSIPSVEQVQDIVEIVFLAEGEYEAAKHYILYRFEHAKQREERPVPDEVREAFAKSDEYFPTELQKFQFFDKYSRFNYDFGRRETWLETVDRSVNFLRELSDSRLSDDVYTRIRKAMLGMEAMPSMRLIAMAGEAARRNNVAIYNCSYVPVDSIDAFVEALIISMSGCGVGYSVESQYVEKFPRIESQNGTPSTEFVVPDSAEGWAEALRLGLQAWLTGKDILFDYSLVRPAGAPLIIKGGRASGPEPLKKMLDFVRTLLFKRQGSVLRPLDAHDIMCAVGSAAISGGVRRTAMIALFDFDDVEMQSCKNGNNIMGNEQRWNANNSAVWPNRKLTQQEVTKFMMGMIESGRGEPGIFSRFSANNTKPARREAADFGTNPCGEVFLRPMQFCNLSIAIARPDDTYETLKEKVEVATIIGTIQSMATHFPGLRPDWNQNNVEERLLGVDINGQMDSLAARDPEIQRKLQQDVLDTNQEYAKLLDIKVSASTTCVKPSGNSSQLFNCSSGVHARWSQYYIRNVRVGAFTPLYKVLRDTGVPMDPENGQSLENADTWVVHFPVKSPDDAITRDQLSAIEQAEYWLQIKTNWTEHNPSVTITYQENEVLDLIKWVWEHQDVIGGMTFLPHFDAQYNQMPFTEITKDEYEELKGNFPEIDFSKIYRYELEDYTTVAQELACFAGGCEE